MIKAIEFPGKVFETKEALYKELRENVGKIIGLKCAEIHKSNEKGQVIADFLTKIETTVKALALKQDYIYPVINTTNYLDGHSDVHFNGLWTKSLKEQAGKLYYITDHDLKIASVIAYPKDVVAYTKNIAWSLVGKDFEGETEALVFEIAKTALVPGYGKQAIEDAQPLQNSVRMQYVKIKLAINSEAKEDVEYKKYFDEKIDLIANKSVALEQGYFWGIEEAKIIKEGSLVLFGSNDATAILSNEAGQKSTSETIEPPESTQQKKKVFINPNFY